MRFEGAPVLEPVDIDALRPTQMTVGLREVDRRRGEVRALETGKVGQFLGRRMIPVVLGPKERGYVIDNHHLLRALHDEGLRQVLVRPIAKLQSLKPDEFWTFMAKRNWLHLYDDEGRLREVKDLPKSVSEMKDDPYRSLAGDLRRAGGYSKDLTPYSEFLWADFLRRRIRPKLVDEQYASALAKAIALAHDETADFLPGWCGPSSD